MTLRRIIALAGGLAIASGAACSDPRSSAGAELTADPHAELTADEELEAPIPSGASVEQIVELKAKKYAAGFVADAPPVSGELSEGGRSDHLAVLKAGHCYRIVAAGGEGVEDLDLFLYEPDGVQSQQDPGEDRYPALGVQAEICPYQPGAYRIQVHMYRGQGPFALRVYRTP